MGSAGGAFAGKIYPADVGQLPPAHVWKDHPRGRPLLARDVARSLSRWWKIFIVDRCEVLHPQVDRAALEFAPAAKITGTINQNDILIIAVEYPI